MRKFSTLLLLLAMPLLSLGQETEQKMVELTSPAGREEYAVLKSDPSTKHGAYLRYGGDNLKTILVRGHYANGQKDSLWVEYDIKGKKAVAQGSYRAGQRVGVWTYNTQAGKPVLKYDFTTGKVVEGRIEAFDGSFSFRPLAGTPGLEVNPVYIDGPMAVLTVLGKYLRYPSQALRNNVQGEVRVACVINSDGEASDFRVVKGLGFGCDDEALRLVRLLPQRWIPARAGGRPVTAECELPVRFAIK